MNRNRLLALRIGIAGLALAHAPAFAQSGHTEQLHCNAVGYGPPEPLGDRKGHAISVSHTSCTVEGGPLDGGVMTGTTIWEWHNTKAVMLSGMGVTRKPGATLAYQNLKGTGALIVSDGKVTGFSGAGRGRCTMATGPAAARKGKTYSYTFKTVGPGQFVIDVTYE